MEKITKEIWKDLPNYEGLYKYSNLLNIKTVERKWVKENILIKSAQPKKDNCEYYSLFKENKYRRINVNDLKNIIINNELRLILDHVELLSGKEITTKSRDRDLVFLRVVFTIIALENTKATPEKIMSFLKRDRAGFYNYKGIFKEVLKIEYCSEIVMLYNEEYLEHNIELNKVLQLTENEKDYRKLETNQQEIYNQRVKPILKSFAWQKAKDEYEVINCSQ